MFFEFLICIFLKVAYAFSLARLRRHSKNNPIQVIFLVSEIAKWKAQSLHDALANDDRFAPVIYVYPTNFESKLTDGELRPILAEKELYFSSKGMNVTNVWNYTEKKCSREYFNRKGVVFYQQPWDVTLAPRPMFLAIRHLTFYIPYYLVNNYSYEAELCMPLHSHVYRYIVQSPELVSFYNRKKMRMYAGKFVGLGHTSTDGYNQQRVNFDFTVIYAPHFSFPNKERPVYYSTFLSNGELILDYAKKHKEVNWVFKPHPRLKIELIESGLWSEEKVEQYYSDWESIGTTCYSADYQNLFVNSDLMITDCGSFLTEYSCTKNPIIRMLSPRLNVEPNPILQDLYSSFYVVHNDDELLHAMDSLIVQRQDPNKEAREMASTKLGLCDSCAAENIKKYLSDLLL